MQFDKDSGKPFVKIDNENITIESFMAGILKKLYCNMSEGLDGLPLMLGVPSYATDYHKQALLKASYIAGIKNVRVVEESSAILYDFLKDNVKELKKGNKDRLIAFVDIGNSKTTITIAGIKADGEASVLLSRSDKTLGGRELDWLILEKLSKDF